ncbi:MAG: transglutaminase domain-containing protein, partial [Sedimenticolaceae bacterium]
PERISPRVIALVAKWQGQTNPGQPLQLVSRALDYFRTQPFVYTLSPGILDGDAMEQFLFETRRGFCEHYAGSFALLMRIAGVPSRVVLGYQGGEPNPHSDHWVVRQADAHAWAEIWLPDLGWWRVDPTAAVAPERIEQSIDTTLSQGADRVVFSVDGQGLLGGVWQDAAWLADAVDLGWHRWVVGFTAERQNGLLQMFGVRKLEGFGLAIALLAGSGLAITFVYLVARLPRPRRIDPLPVLWQGFLRKVHRAGVQTAPWQGPDTVCTLATKTFPDASRQLSAINRMYVQLRYGRQSDPQQIRALRRHIRELDLR